MKMVERNRVRYCPTNLISIVNVVCFILLILLVSGIIEFPSSSYFSSISSLTININDAFRSDQGFTDLVGAFKEWDSQVGCAGFRQKLHNYTVASSINASSSSSLKEETHGGGGGEVCEGLKMKHVSVLVKGWSWIPDNLDNLYSCRCGLSCLWTKSPVLADNPDALLFENARPPRRRHVGEPLRVYMDLEPERKRTGREDIFISYHAKDDIQTTYAGAFFHNNRNYHISSRKNSSTMLGGDVACWVTMAEPEPLALIPCLAGFVSLLAEKEEEMQIPIEVLDRLKKLLEK